MSGCVGVFERGFFVRGLLDLDKRVRVDFS